MYKSKVLDKVYYLNKNSFKKIKGLSFDYAILEKSKNINGIKLNISLTDLGNWREIWKFFNKNKSTRSIKKNIRNQTKPSDHVPVEFIIN